VLKALRRMLEAAPADTHVVPAHERRQLQLAVAVLLHEARRADYAEGDEETTRGQQALADIFGLQPAQSAALLEEGRAKAQHLTSLYAPLTTVKRDFSLEERVRLVEHLWRVAFAHGDLDPYEDHYVRKVAHLLYVPNTQNMLARNRARA
jgi:uncharacterized tellurite resistance protein B-like protein